MISACSAAPTASWRRLYVWMLVTIEICEAILYISFKMETRRLCSFISLVILPTIRQGKGISICTLKYTKPMWYSRDNVINIAGMIMPSIHVMFLVRTDVSAWLQCVVILLNRETHCIGHGQATRRKSSILLVLTFF